MGIYDTNDSRSFNEAMNELAGTNGVAYSAQWPMHVRNGADYMREYHADVGRVYAEELLHNRIGSSSVLALHMDHDDLNNQQRALLTCLADTGNTVEFEQMMRTCIKGNALPTTAGMYFSKPMVQRRAANTDNQGLPHIDYAAVLRNMEKAQVAQVAQVEPVPQDAVMEDVAPTVLRAASPISYSVQSPPRAPAVHVNPPGSASRTLSLKGGAGKRRKTFKT